MCRLRAISRKLIPLLSMESPNNKASWTDFRLNAQLGLERGAVDRQIDLLPQGEQESMRREFMAILLIEGEEAKLQALKGLKQKLVEKAQ